jgi:hypothetical protein
VKVEKDKAIVLMLDGDDFHKTPDMQQLGYDHQIIILCLPSKTTHKFQPLDVTVFNSVE